MPTLGKNKFPWALWKNRDSNDRLYSSSSPGPSSRNSSGNSSPDLPRSAPASYRELPEDPLEENNHLSSKLTGSGFTTPRSIHSNVSTERNLSHQSLSALFGLPRVESPKSEPPSTPDMQRIDSSTQALTVNRADQDAVRPWKDTPRHHWFVSPEQMMMHDETRKVSFHNLRSRILDMNVEYNDSVWLKLCLAVFPLRETQSMMLFSPASKLWNFRPSRDWKLAEGYFCKFGIRCNKLL